jgi:hypothetical protein
MWIGIELPRPLPRPTNTGWSSIIHFVGHVGARTMRTISLAILTIAGAGLASLSPTDASAETARQLANFRNPASKVMLNPQPLPPREALASLKGNPASKVTLNPQPLPPKETLASLKGNPASKVMLNPQPLPPRDGGLSKMPSAGLLERDGSGFVRGSPSATGSPIATPSGLRLR